GALSVQEKDDLLRARTGLGRVRLSNKRGPERHMSARQQSDGCSAHGRSAPVAAIVAPVARSKPRPGQMAGEAAVVKPGRFVAGKARGKDFRLPGGGGRPEALKLLHHFVERIRPLHARLFGDPLPGRQEAQKVARGNGLDLRAQPLDSIAVNPGEQAALAPFLYYRPA